MSQTIHYRLHILEATDGKGGVITPWGPGPKQETELANLDLVSVDQHRVLDRFMIDVSAVEAVEIDEQVLSVLKPKLGVVAAEGGVVEQGVQLAEEATGARVGG